ncbi:MAG: insulinase family protein [Polyangiaceae bacterium]|jgi:predicted Zn-dependent peptidase|nr:insulinase family protein [Polyangiaceae bacterium]
MRTISTLRFAALAALALTVACEDPPRPVRSPRPPPAPAPAPPAPPSPDAWRAQMPAPGAAPQLVLPRFEKATLANGLTVIVVTRHELPVVSVGLAFGAGSSSDPRDQAGTADLAYQMLAEGAGGKDALALDTAFSDLGAGLTIGTRPDGALASTRVLRRNLEPALALLADVVLKPTFAAKDFERRKKQTLSDLARRAGEPRFLAQQAFVASAFGPEHPYGHLVVGSTASVERLTLAQVKSFYQVHTGPRASAIIFAGDVTLEQATALAQKQFGAWKGDAALPPPPPTPPTPERAQVVVVPKAGLQQTIVLVGRPGVASGNPDEAKLDLATAVFGGFFGSRLNMNLREAKGYTYGARSDSDARLGVGPLSVISPVRADVTGPALQEVFGELKGMKGRPITTRELEEAREGLVRAFPGSFETVEGLAASAAGLFFGRRPLDEYEAQVKALQGASAAQVQAVAESFFEPGRMQVVLVGDPDLIRAQTSALGLGPLVMRAPEGPTDKPKAPAGPADKPKPPATR